jgi:serine/threonine protein phosphatase PrpC
MIEAYGLTDVGCVRERNEDRILLDESLRLYAVADGMGGHAHGEIAAELAITTIRHYMESSQDRLDVTWPFGYNFDLSIEANRLSTSIQLANSQVWRQAEQVLEYAGLGTTIAAVLLSDKKLTVGNVGDSRVYLWRAGLLQQLTVDDTWIKAISDLGNRIDVSHFRNFLTQAAGSKSMVDVHIIEENLAAGDVIVLSSDGLHGFVSDPKISAVIAAEPSLKLVGASLVRLAKSAGGPDNISVILLGCRV